jgi:hypothetical protein
MTVITETDLFHAPPRSIEEALTEAESVRLILLTESDSGIPVPPEGRWSLDENLYHLHLIERGIASAVRRMIEGEKGEAATHEHIQAVWQRMKMFTLDRSFALPAPTNVSPLNAPSREESLNLLAESRARLQQHLQKTTYDELLRTEFPHPVFGMIPGVLWTTFIGMHEMRHIHQIRELKQP